MTPWTLILIVVVFNGPKEWTLTVPGYNDRRSCLTAAVWRGMEALRMGMDVRSFDCVPGNL